MSTIQSTPDTEVPHELPSTSLSADAPPSEPYPDIEKGRTMWPPELSGPIYRATTSVPPSPRLSFAEMVAEATGQISSDPRPPEYDQDFDHKKPWTKYPIGYPRFSAFLANDEDKSTTIFRRFQRLSARNILYLESELADLEEEQNRLDEESRHDDALKASMRSWNLLCLQATPPSTDRKMESAEEVEKRLHIQEAARQRLHLAFRIREVLQTYHETLKRESEVLALSSPDRRPLKGVRRVFVPSYDKDTGTGKGAAMLHGTMKTHLDEENKQDLCVLAPPVERDRLTKLLEGRLSYFFRTRTEDGLSDFVSHSRVSVAVSIISGVLATIFLIGAILGLYWVQNPNAKLGMLSGLTVAFAGSLALFTNARRQDVFAATAAYAAVLVVFVSGNLASNSQTAPTQLPLLYTSTITTVHLETSTILITATASTVQTVTTTDFSLFGGDGGTTSTIQTNTATSLPSASPSSSSGGGYSDRDRLALGVGLGVGLPALIAVMVALFYMCCRKRK